MEIIKDLRNELLKRRELEFVIENKSNPTFEEITKKVSEVLKVKPENILVINIINSFGKRTFDVSVHIYDSKEKLKEIKDLSKTKKQKTEEKKAKEEEAKKAKEDKEAQEAAKNAPKEETTAA